MPIMGIWCSNHKTAQKIRLESKRKGDLDVNMDGDDDNNDKNNQNNKNDDMNEKKIIMFCLLLHVHVLTHMLCNLSDEKSKKTQNLYRTIGSNKETERYSI